MHIVTNDIIGSRKEHAIVNAEEKISKRDNKTILLKLRDAAKECSNVDYRELLRNQANNLQECLDWVCTRPDNENMRKLVGAWAQAERLLNNVPPEGTPAPVSGSPEPALLAA